MQSDLDQDSDTSSSSSDSDSDSSSSSSDDENQPQPSQPTGSHLEVEYVAPLRTAARKPLTPGRKKVFNPNQLNANMWSKKSIAYEMSEMVHALRGHIEDFQGNPSDIDFMSDSADLVGVDDGDEKGDNTIINGLPNLDSYTHVLSELTTSQSLSEPKYEMNKLMKNKLDSLHDKISVFIKKIAHEMTRTRNQKLINTYQNAYDFLDDIQHEIETFDENIVKNEAKLQQMETSIKHGEQKYKSLMVKFKAAKSAEKQLRATELDLKKQVWELNLAQSDLLLSERNSYVSDEESDDEKKDLSDDDSSDSSQEPESEPDHQPRATTVIHQKESTDTASTNYGQSLIQKKPKKKRLPLKKKPNLVFNPPKRPTMPKFKSPPAEPSNVKNKPKAKYKLKKDIDPKRNPHLYNENITFFLHAGAIFIKFGQIFIDL